VRSQRLARAAGVAALLALAGCGSSVTSSASSDDGCSPPAGYRPLRAELPRGLAPAGTLVSGVHRSGRTTTGNLFFTDDVNGTFLTLRAATANAGYEASLLDNEGFESEVEVRRPDDQLFFKLQQIQGCDTAARGHFIRYHG
jgi:hypothetical protein